MLQKQQYADINTIKANFDDIYISPDPRDYFSVLGALDYMIPDIAAPIIRQILARKAKVDGTNPVVLDIGCSYGINAAITRFPINFSLLQRRYSVREMMEVSSEELRRLDRNFYASWADDDLAQFIGLDVSAPAIQYAKSVGLIQDGLATDLENGDLSDAAKKVIAPVDVLLSTGCVGYVTEKTFSKLLSHVKKSPWVISFVLRMFPYDEIERTLSRNGLVTEHLTSATFVQRRFRTEDEFQSTLDSLAKRDVNPEGFESQGLLFADLYVSRPEAEAEACPLENLVTVGSGRNRPTGPRFVQFENSQGLSVGVET